MTVIPPKSGNISLFTGKMNRISALFLIVFTLSSLLMTIFSMVGALSLIPLALIWGGNLLRFEDSMRLLLIVAGAELLVFIAALWLLPLAVILQLFTGLLVLPLQLIKNQIHEQDPVIIGILCGTVVLLSVAVIISSSIQAWPMILFCVALGAGIVVVILLYNQMIRHQYLS